MKTYWGAEVQLHTFLTSALDEGKLTASCQRGDDTKIIVKY